MILAPTLTLNTPAGSRLDADAAAFAAASGATDVAALSEFVKGVKALGLWNKHGLLAPAQQPKRRHRHHGVFAGWAGNV
jgi:hypothetical protein